MDLDLFAALLVVALAGLTLALRLRPGRPSCASCPSAEARTDSGRSEVLPVGALSLSRRRRVRI